MKTWTKILTSVLITIAMALGGLAATILLLLTGNNFYATITVAALIVVWLFALARVWNLLRRKTRCVTAAALLSALVLTAICHSIYNVYLNSIDEVNDQGVNLTLYEPFRPDTKAAALNEPSTLTLTYNLPKMDGATALYPLYSAFAMATYPEDYYPAYITKEDDYVVCTNTVGAYQRLISGEADIIFVAGPSSEQLKMAEEAGVELTLTPIGLEAFVFFVNKSNPVDNLTVDEIRKVYSGEIDNWREFGGKNKKIKAYQRPINSGSQTALINLMGDTPLMKPPSNDVVGGMGGIITRVSAYKNFDSAVGYSFLFFATEMVKDNKIKLLSLNGIMPTRENVSNQTYPYASEFYAVTAGTTNPNVTSLIEWILSAQGQYLVGKTGYTPLALYQ